MFVVLGNLIVCRLVRLWLCLGSEEQQSRQTLYKAAKSIRAKEEPHHNEAALQQLRSVYDLDTVSTCKVLRSNVSTEEVVTLPPSVPIFL